MELSKHYLRVKFALQGDESVQYDSTSEDEIYQAEQPEESVTYTSTRRSRHKRSKLQRAQALNFRIEDRSEAFSDLHVTLHQAARDGDVKLLKMFLDNLSPEALALKLNNLEENKLAPLHYAARYNYVGAVELLLSKGADVNIKGEDGLTPLHFAARYGYSKNVIQEVPDSIPTDPCQTVICLMVENGAFVNCKDDYGMTPLHYAAMRGNVSATQQLLYCSDICTEVSDKQDMTPLHCAANYKNAEIVKLLLDAGAVPQVYDENRSTPLHLAATSGSEEIVILLLEAVEKRVGLDGMKAFIEERNKFKTTALHLAVDIGHLNIVNVLLEKGADVKAPRENYSQPLHLAAVSGNVDIVRSLVDHGAEVNCFNAYRETPLHKAAAFNRTDVITYLLENKAFIECRDNEHFTPLLIASSEGHVEAIKLLLEAGADVDVVDKMDRSVLFWAAQENHPNALKALLEYSSTSSLVNRCDRYDNSPLHIAALKGYKKIVEILMRNCAAIESKNENEETALHLAAKHGHISVAEVLLRHSNNIVNAEDENSETPLHVAALAGHHEMVSLLLNSGGNVEARNCYLWSPLDCAAYRGWTMTSQILLNAGCPVDPEDKSKTTPLHLAAREGHTKVVRLLLKWGANISLCDKNGKNCLDLALEKGHEDVAFEILSDKNWEQVLRNESEKNKFGIHQTPLRRLIKRMPDVAEFVFDKCIQKNEVHSDNAKLEVTYNYEFLDDMFANYKAQQREVYSDDYATGNSESTNFCSESDIYTKEGYVKPTALPYTDNKDILKFNHPLMLMVTHHRRGLLNHPLCSSLLQHKWNSYGCYVYYSNFLVFILFLIFLTGYVLTALPPCPQPEIQDKTCCQVPDLGNNSTCRPFFVCRGSANASQLRTVIRAKSQHSVSQLYSGICKNFIYVLVFIHLLKELYQMYQNGSRYLTVENLLEWGCYLSAVIFVCDVTECSALTGIREVWQWELGSLSIFSAWMILVAFISKFPFLGIYVIMFVQILSTFVNFFVVFFLFVVAFALAFYTLLQNQDPFETPGESIIKTSVMMIGEFEFDAIFNDPENEVLYKKPAYLLFVLFMLLMAIIIMNLLVGLAVDDIKGVQEQAQLKRLAMRVELVLTVERILPIVALRHLVIKTRVVRPNAWKNLPRILRSLRERMRSMYSTSSETSAVEELKEQQTDLAKQLKEIQDSLRALMKETKNLETLVETKLGASSQSVGQL